MHRRVLLALLSLCGLLAVWVVQARTGARHALLLTGEGPLSGADRAVAERLKRLGYAVDVQPARTAASVPPDAALVLLSSTAPAQAAARLAGLPAPIVTWSAPAFAALGLAGPEASLDFGVSDGEGRVDVADGEHPLSAGLSGGVRVTTASAPLAWAVPGAHARWIAGASADANHAAAFAYEAGAPLVAGRAAARRVGLFLTPEAIPALTADGWRLFDAAVAWAAARNRPPRVDAGTDQQVELGVAVELAGAVADDGAPEGHEMQVGWSAAAGPGAVHFDDPGSPRARALFTAPGLYTLRLEAGDGHLSSADEVRIQVRPRAAGAPADAPEFTASGGQGPDAEPIGKVLMIVSGGPRSAGDRAIERRLRDRPYIVVVKSAAQATHSDLDGKDVVVVTGTSPLPQVDILKAGTPLVVLKAGLFQYLGFTAAGTNKDFGNTIASELTVADTPHPLAAGLGGRVAVTSGATFLGWGVPAAGATVAATLPGGRRAASFGYEAGATMAKGKAPARRVGLFVSDFAAARLTNSGWKLFDAAVDWAAAGFRPQVDAGPDGHTVPDTPFLLNGTVISSRPVLTLTWTLQTPSSGDLPPNCVTFSAATAEDTQVKLCQAGRYTLELTANDGQNSVSDTVDVECKAGTNEAPEVHIGPIDRSLALPAVLQLSATATDDNIPSQPGLKLIWSKQSGPGGVVFGDPSAAKTTASFGTTGEYVLRFAATDGVLEAWENVTVQVSGTAAALLVVGNRTTLSPGDAVYQQRLEALGHAVTVVGDATATAADAADKAVVVISSSVAGSTAGMVFRDVPIPTVVTAPDLYDEMGMAAAGGTHAGVAVGQVQVQIAMPDHRLAAGLRGSVDVVAAPAPLGWSEIPAGARAETVASLAGSAGHAAVFAYEAGAPMAARHPAAGRRVGLFLTEPAAALATARGLALFDAAVAWAVDVNAAPMADAGPDRRARLNATITLQGRAADDGLPEPAALRVAWTRVSGPEAVTFADAARAETDATFAAEGTYELQLAAADGAGRATADRVTVTVSGANQPPLVDAGPGHTAALPGTVALAGSATDDGLPEPAALAYAWTKVSGPGLVKFEPADRPVTRAEFEVSGRYVLRLTVSDGEHTASDDVTINGNGTALLVVGAGPLSAGDAAIRSRMEALGFDVEVKEASKTTAEDADAKNKNRLLVWLSASSRNADLLQPGNRCKFLDAAVPVVTAAAGTFDNMHLTGGRTSERGNLADQTKASILPAAESHPLAAGLRGVVSVGSVPGNFSWGVPRATGRKIVTPENMPERAVIFAYDAGVERGWPKARRVGFGFFDNTLATLTAEGTALVDAALAWAIDGNMAPRIAVAPVQALRVSSEAVLEARVSDDGRPDPPRAVRVAWSLEGGPGTVTFGNPAEAATTARFSTAGEYVLRLTADDGERASSARVRVRVFTDDEPNTAPVVDAGPPQRAVRAHLPLALHGSVRDDGLPLPTSLEVAWSVESGDAAAVTFDSNPPRSADAVATFTRPGVFVLQLRANDGLESATDTVRVEVRPALQALFVATKTPRASGDPLNPDDQAATNRLKSRGFELDVVDYRKATAALAAGKHLVVISGSVSGAALRDRFRGVAVPVLAWEQTIFGAMGLTGTSPGVDHGVLAAGQHVAISDPQHPLAAGLQGTLTVNAQEGQIRWGVPAATAFKVATLPGDAAKATIFGYGRGAALIDGLGAPARRVGLFVRPSILTPTGWRLFDAAVDWLVQPEVPALLVVPNPKAPNLLDRLVRRRLETLGFRVEMAAAPAVLPDQAAGKAVVVVSSSVRDNLLGPAAAAFAGAAVPVVTWKAAFFRDLHMTGPTPGKDFGVLAGQTAVAIADAGHPLAGGLGEGRQVVASAGFDLSWGRPLASAVVAATVAEAGPGDADAAAEARATVFGYELDAELAAGRAPDRRVGLFHSITGETWPLTAKGWSLFDAGILWATGGDADQDGLTTYQEHMRGTDPRNSDTDGDGTPDGDEAFLAESLRDGAR